ncbi:MAG: parallel beta-helix domain-containing protein [Bradymonadia bacterium]
MKYFRGTVFLALSLNLSACGGGDDNAATGPDLPEGCDAYVVTGETEQDDLQLALIEASENSTVCIGEGTFRFTTEISSSENGVTIRGMGSDKTILDFSDQDVGSNGLHITGNGVTLEDFEVRNAAGDGIRSEDVSDITYRRLRVVWTESASSGNGAYGLYPVKSTNVIVEDCYVEGASDAGIYVGQSSNIIVRRNEVTGNVAGIEIENSVDAEVTENNVYGNTGGVLIFNLPELPMKDGKRAKVHNNQIKDNNLPNFAKPGAFVYNVPAGSGVIILASDDNEVSNNIITGNDSAAIILTSYLDDIFGGFDDAEFDRNTEGNYVFGNTYDNNGRNPQGIIAALELSEQGRCSDDDSARCYVDGECSEGATCEGASGTPDIIWDGCTGDNPGPSNCFDEASDVTFSTPPNFNFCVDAAARGETNIQADDLSEYACERDALPNQDPAMWTN